MDLRTVFFWTTIVFSIYACHHCLSYEYTKRCNGDLLRFIMFNESRMCSMISYLLNTVEMITKQSMSLVSFFVMSTVDNILRSRALYKNNVA
jgi:hypothetical protein